MESKIKTVAFDLGGVLAYQDLSKLSKEELHILKAIMNKNNNVNKEFLEYAKSRILEIYLKIHKLNPETISTLEMLNQEKIIPSIWTNNIREIDIWLEEARLYRYIKKENIINSFYLGFDKPRKDFYFNALFRLKNEPKDVLFLDDKKVNVLNAISCGINAKEYAMSENLTEKVAAEIRKR